MPKRNYAFDKRQKDLKKKQKQEDKLRRRLERKAQGLAAESTETDAALADPGEAALPDRDLEAD